MIITKKKIEKLALGIFIVLVATFVASVILNWLRGRSESRKLLEWVDVSIIEIDNSIPPGMIIEIENSGPREVGRTHIRLWFSTIEDEIICGVHRDLESLRPNEERRLFLKCDEKDFSSQYRSGRPIKVKYFLQVFPEQKSAKEPLKGEFYLK